MGPSSRLITSAGSKYTMLGIMFLITVSGIMLVIDSDANACTEPKVALQVFKETMQQKGISST